MAMALAGLFIYLTGCAGFPGAASKDASLGSRVMEAISDAVYEVVVLKPTKDSLQYEKPLPMDLLPYSIRTDKYYSVGTAFAISPSEFVSAAHVMNLGSGSQFKEAFLRDREGKVYSIERVLKYLTNSSTFDLTRAASSLYKRISTRVTTVPSGRCESR